MLVIIGLIFIATLVWIILILTNKINAEYLVELGNFSNLEEEFKKLNSKDNQLRSENSKKEQDVINTMNLYEVTKEICEFLEEDKIFATFKNGLSKFIQIEKCSYVEKSDFQNNLLISFNLIPLVSETGNLGYLAIKGLKDADRPILDILIAQFVSSIKRARLYKQVQALAITDSLTKTFTRRYTLERFQEELKRSQNFNLPLSFLMIDIDNFKFYNDKYGHLVGDAILKSIGDIIKNNSREIDLIGRYGGEEFMVVLPMTSKDGALFAAERVRKSVEAKEIKAFDEKINLTISIGVASFPQDAVKEQELIDKADWALYRSKQTGKNRVTAFAVYK